MFRLPSLAKTLWIKNQQREPWSDRRVQQNAILQELSQESSLKGEKFFCGRVEV